MWQSFNSRWASSARSELAATMVAMLGSGPVHTALDNKAVCDKACKLIALAREKLSIIYAEYADPQCEEPAHMQEEVSKAVNILARKSPLKKPWAMQADGDLWSQYWAILIRKSPWAVRHSKVKGHATKKMVEEGKVEAKDKEGNDKSDYAANKGTNAIIAGARGLAKYYQSREKRYTELAIKVVDTIISTVRTYQSIIKEQEKRQ